MRRVYIGILLIVILLSSSFIAYAGGGGGGGSSSKKTCYLDYDLDGYGASSDITVTEDGEEVTYSATIQINNRNSCLDQEPKGLYHEANQLDEASTDCDDTDEFTHPGASEFCDGQDNNCNNVIDEADDSPPEEFTSFTEYSYPKLSAKDLEVPLVESGADFFCQEEGFDGSESTTTFFSEELGLNVISSVICFEEISVYDADLNETIVYNETNDFSNPSQIIDRDYELPLAQGSELFYCAKQGFDRVVLVDYETQNDLTAHQIDLLDAYPELSQGDTLYPTLKIENNEFIFSLNSPIVSSVTCGSSESLLVGSKNVCDFQTKFEYTCEANTLMVYPFQYIEDSASPSSTFLVPTIYYDNYDLTYSTLQSFNRLYREKWSNASLQYLTSVFDPDKRIEYCEADSCLFDFLDGEANSLVDTSVYKNLCCGDDPHDEGYVLSTRNNGNFVCVKNPNGVYEWISQGSLSTYGTRNFVDGNIYEVNSKEYSLQETPGVSRNQFLSEDSGELTVPSITSSREGWWWYWDYDYTKSAEELIEIPSNAYAVDMELFCDVYYNQKEERYRTGSCNSRSRGGCNYNYAWRDIYSESILDTTLSFVDEQGQVIASPVSCSHKITDTNEYIDRQRSSGVYQIPNGAIGIKVLVEGDNVADGSKGEYSLGWYRESVTETEVEKVLTLTDTDISYDILSTNENWFVCGDYSSGHQYDELYNKIQAGNTVDFQTLGSIHQYLCYDTGSEYEFAECKGDSQYFNYFYPTAQDMSSEYDWSRPSIAFNGAVTSLATFEKAPKDIDFKIDSYSQIQVSYDSSKSYEGQRSLRVSMTVTESQNKGVDLVIFSDDISKDVSSFEYLEGYVYFEDVVLLDVILNDQRYALDEFIVGKKAKNTWLHFSIPLHSMDTLESLSFIMPTQYLNYQKEQKYSYFLDNLYLLDQESKSFCGKEVVYGQATLFKWYEDRDDNKAACEITGNSWTGNACCGDDLGEYYTDEFGICWNGDVIPTGSRVQPINFIINGISYDTFCTDTQDCIYELPRLTVQQLPEDTSVLEITNPNQNLYDVFFTSNGLNTSTNIHDTITVNVKQYVLAHLDNEFLACGDTSLVPNKEGLQFIDELDKREETGVCSISNYFVCDGQGWTSSFPIDSNDDGSIPGFGELLNVNYVPEEFSDTANIASGCCPSNYCWNGNFCVEDQSNEPTGDVYFPTGNNSGYRCMAGEWVEAKEKFSPYGTTSGYCPEEDQCFVSDQGSFADNNNLSGRPQCIDDGQYFGEFYCDAGVYESRTKQLFNSLQSSFDVTDYTIYCDTASNVFNYLGTIDGKDVASYISGSNACTYSGLGYQAPCMNNFCVMNSPSGIAFGTTINQELNAEEYSVVELFSIPSVEDCEGSSDLTACGNNWYYDGKINSLVNSEFGVAGNSFFSSLFDSVKSFFFGEDIILSLTYEELAEEMGLEEFIQLGFKDSLFYAKDGSNSIVAINGELREVQTGKELSYVGAKYTGYDGLCSYIRESSQFKTSCETSGDETYIFVISEGSVSIWTDLSSKLRLFED